MVNYRRIRIPGGTFFFTVTLRDRRDDTLVRHVDVLREAFRMIHALRPWRTDAIVIMPDHLHALWTLLQHDMDYAGRWRAIKSAFVRGLRRKDVVVQVNAKGEADIWQRRFWEHVVRDETDFERHVDYIHINPVKHGYVASAADWPHSSIHRYIRQRRLPADWGVEVGEGGGFGE
jgi:putative transposase